MNVPRIPARYVEKLMHTKTRDSDSSSPLVRDRVENFNGNQVIYVGWDHHTMICSPIALLVSPELPFGKLIDQLLPATAFAQHPDWSRIDWPQVEWLSSDKPFKPAHDISLKAQGLGHKAFLRMRTPAFRGIGGTGS